ncbi:MAG: M23 family metallopeptidase [Alkalinema sp. RU_4_3]|nr:M23 family metallopeptidase [Alkalinema sp. RU_4_3]
MVFSFLLASALSAQDIPIAQSRGSVVRPPSPLDPVMMMPVPPTIAYPGGWSPGDRNLRAINPRPVGYLLPNNLSPDFYQATPWQVESGPLSLHYPLSTVVPITSGVGWRVHPISGDRRFHAGTDFGAPEGTPVLAASTGRVTEAKRMGGYGLAVTIEHQNGRYETLYGHLSELLVSAGEPVRSGQVIGRVGSTGASTGPHLHFELRQQSAKGWVTLDPAGLLRQAQNLARN